MQLFNSLRALALTATLGVSLALSPAHAQDFRLAMSSPPNSMDPHFYNLFSNINVSDHMFETLVPIHHQVTTWAAKRTIDYVGRTDERTYAHAFFPKR